MLLADESGRRTSQSLAGRFSGLSQQRLLKSMPGHSAMLTVFLLGALKLKVFDNHAGQAAVCSQKSRRIWSFGGFWTFSFLQSGKDFGRPRCRRIQVNPSGSEGSPGRYVPCRINWALSKCTPNLSLNHGPMCTPLLRVIVLFSHPHVRSQL